MKTTIKAALLSSCIISTSAMAENPDLSLEPCENGQVSASGLFPTQAAEDRFVKAQYEARQRELEPCSNGSVSASGLFPNQEAEDRYQRRQVEQQGQYRFSSSDHVSSSTK